MSIKKPTCYEELSFLFEDNIVFFLKGRLSENLVVQL